MPGHVKAGGSKEPDPGKYFNLHKGVVHRLGKAHHTNILNWKLPCKIGVSL